MFQNQLFLTFCLFCTFPITKVTAQIAPDNTLDKEKIKGDVAIGDNPYDAWQKGGDCHAN